MAKYKKTGGSPTSSQRIQGVQYNVTDGGGFLHGWGYPVSRPSNQFSRYNFDAQRLDQKFAALPAMDQAAWNDAADNDDDWIFCMILRQYYQYYGTGLTGVQIYRAVNLSRIAQGMEESNIVPAHSTPEAGDAIALTNDSPYEITWTRALPAFALSYKALVYQSPASSFPSSFNGTRRMRLLGALDIVPSVPVDITPLLVPPARLWAGGVCNLAFAIAESGDAPFALAFTSFNFEG